MVPTYECIWSPSPYQVRLPDPEDETTECFIDLGLHTSDILSRDIDVDIFRERWYWRNRDLRPAEWLPTEESELPPLPPDIPPSSFNVFVAWDSSE